MASQAADLQQVQAQMIRSLDQIQSLSMEIASMNTKMDFLNTDRIAKDQQIQNLIFGKPSTLRCAPAHGLVCVDEPREGHRE